MSVSPFATTCLRPAEAGAGGWAGGVAVVGGRVTGRGGGETGVGSDSAGEALTGEASAGPVGEGRFGSDAATLGTGVDATRERISFKFARVVANSVLSCSFSC